MKKLKRVKAKDRIGVSLNINIDNDVDVFISPNNPHEFHMNQTLPQEENELAHYIATALDDTDALPLHLKIVRKNPAHVVMQIFHYVMDKPRKDITSSRAAYYNYLMGLYERTGKCPRS